MSPGTAIGIQMNLGYLGSYSRNGDCIIMTRKVRKFSVGTTPAGNINFGDAVILNPDSLGGTWQQWADYISGSSGTPTFAMFGGFAAREVKSFETFIPIPTINFYAANSPCDVIERGSVIVKCAVGTPTAGGLVYCRKTLNGAIPAGLLGSIEATVDGTNQVLLTNCYFTTGVMDANLCTEITLVSRNLP